MAAALSWLLVSLVVFNSNCIDIRANSVFRGYSGDLLDQTIDNTLISGSTDLFSGRSKKLSVPDTFQLSVLLIRMRHRLTTHEVYKSRPRLVLPKIRIDLLRRRLQGLRRLSAKAPVILRGGVGDIEQLQLFLRRMP